MEGTIGEIRLFGGTFAPNGWAFCDGSPLPIAEYEALYSVIGVTYGGNGQTNFNVPDFRGRLAVGTGAGYSLGAAGGIESVTMTIANLPQHTHVVAPVSISIPTYSESGNQATPTNNTLASLATLYSTENADTNLTPPTVTSNLSVAGAGIPISVMQPYTALYYIICTEGIYPTRPN